MCFEWLHKIESQLPKSTKVSCYKVLEGSTYLSSWRKLIVKGCFCIIQDSLDQCPMQINVNQCWSVSTKIMALIRNASQCWSLPINSDQFLSMPINAGSRHHYSISKMEVIRIDQHWSILRSMPEFLSSLIGLGHWLRKSW